MTINTPESDNSFHVSVLAGDQSSAFSQELLRLSGPNPHSDGIAFPPGQGDQSSGRVDQLPISIEQLPVRVDPAGNSAVDALPPLTVEQQSQLPSSSVEQQSKPSSSLGEVTNSILDISLGAAAIAAGDIAPHCADKKSSLRCPGHRNSRVRRQFSVLHQSENYGASTGNCSGVDGCRDSCKTLRSGRIDWTI